MAPLDDATLLEVRLASPTDIVRYTQAQEESSRESFGGVSFSDGKGHILASFTADEYDRYLAYERDHPLPQPIDDTQQQQIWPKVLISFQSGRRLFDPDASLMPSACFYLCDAKADERNLCGFGMPHIVWHDRFVVMPKHALEIEKARQGEVRPQKYEIFFDYVYRDHEQPLALPGDLCISFHRWNYPLPSSVGRPMRVSKDKINDAIDPLLRSFPSKDEHTR